MPRRWAALVEVTDRGSNEASPEQGPVRSVQALRVERRSRLQTFDEGVVPVAASSSTAFSVRRSVVVEGLGLLDEPDAHPRG